MTLFEGFLIVSITAVGIGIPLYELGHHLGYRAAKKAMFENRRER